MFPTNGGVQVEDGFPSCLPGSGGGPPSAVSAFPAIVSLPELCASPSLDWDVFVPEIGLAMDVFEGLVEVPVGALLAVAELFGLLIPSPGAWGVAV